MINHLLQFNPNIFVDQINKSTKYIPTKNKIILANFPSIQHEIAHFVELNDLQRLTQIDFGFTTTENSLNIFQHNPKFLFAVLAREARVIAIQQHIKQRRSPNPNDSLAIKTFGNPTWFKAAYSHLPFGRFQTEKDVDDWILDIITKTFCAWSPDRIEFEWFRKMQFIKNWQETK